MEGQDAYNSMKKIEPEGRKLLKNPFRIIYLMKHQEHSLSNTLCFVSKLSREIGNKEDIQELYDFFLEYKHEAIARNKMKRLTSTQDKLLYKIVKLSEAALLFELMLVDYNVYGKKD